MYRVLPKALERSGRSELGLFANVLPRRSNTYPSAHAMPILPIRLTPASVDIAHTSTTTIMVCVSFVRRDAPAMLLPGAMFATHRPLGHQKLTGATIRLVPVRKGISRVLTSISVCVNLRIFGTQQQTHVSVLSPMYTEVRKAASVDL